MRRALEGVISLLESGTSRMKVIFKRAIFQHCPVLADPVVADPIAGSC